MPELTIRLAEPADAEAIRTIYNVEVLDETSTFDLVPRSLADQEAWLADRSGAFSAIVAVDTTPTATRWSGSPPSRRTSPGPPTARPSRTPSTSTAGRGGEGIGKLLLTSLLDVATASGFHAVMARIEASGTASRALHARCGFELVGIEREVGRKFNRWLDVAVMQCLL